MEVLAISITLLTLRCGSFLAISNTLLTLRVRCGSSLAISNTLLMLCCGSTLAIFKHPLDATLWKFSGNFKHALDAMLWKFSCNFEHALDAMLWKFSCCFQQGVPGSQPKQLLSVRVTTEVRKNGCPSGKSPVKKKGSKKSTSLMPKLPCRCSETAIGIKKTCISR